MAQERVLPKKRNPLLAPDKTPEHSELVAKRRLGQTHLAVKPGQVGTSNATKPENLGMFDYAHLRAPLPENLKSSEIFAPQPKQPHPEAYFLMRRSSDGYVSATGMFKASFPWAKHAEEQAERMHIKGLPITSHDEVAGNVWIPEDYALELAEDYGIGPWIRALLDPAPVSSGGDDKKSISPPPKFIFKANGDTSLPPPSATPRGRGRPRARSPSKIAAPTKALSPRKPRPSHTKSSKRANASSGEAARSSLQPSIDDGASRADTESADEERHDEIHEVDQKDKVEESDKSEEKVTVEVDSTIEVNGDTETTHTKLTVEMPSGNPNLPLPETTEEMITRAKEMVEEARKLEGESLRSGTKRKAEELDDDDDEEEDEEKDKELQPAKKARLLEKELKKQRVRSRALIGIAATLAIGSVLQFSMERDAVADFFPGPSFLM
ncbi:MAG: hypothetical protein Q9187_003150 [Circinaria calcarea]